MNDPGKMSMAMRFLVRRVAVAARLDEQLSSQADIEGQKTAGFSNTVANTVYWLVFLLFLPAVLNALALPGLLAPVQEMVTKVLAFLPNLFAAAVVVLLAYVVGRVVAGLCTNLLTSIGFNRLPVALGLAKEKVPAPGQRTPSEIVGYLLLVATVLFAVMQALPIMGFDLLAGLISQFLVFAGHVLMGLVIFAIGLYLANLAARVVRTAAFAQATLVALAARVSIIVLAAAMALRQMGLANEIITSAFTILVGAIGVALALAFGLGGRDAAGRTLEGFIEARKTEPLPSPQATQQPVPPEAPLGAPTQPPATPGAPLDMPTQPPTPGSFTGPGDP